MSKRDEMWQGRDYVAFYLLLGVAAVWTGFLVSWALLLLRIGG